MTASDLRHRRTIRLPDCDYSHPGAYFVTVCTRNRAPMFGEIADGKMLLNLYGHVADESWVWLSEQYSYVNVGEWVVMPNHLHGILFLGVADRPLTSPYGVKSLGRLVGAFKLRSTRRINDLRGVPGLPVWQRNYHEHIIRDETDLDHICEYIINNPTRWLEDEENPDRLTKGTNGRFSKRPYDPLRQ